MNKYHQLKPCFTDWQLDNKTVLLRVDCNMTYVNNDFLSDFKLRRITPTINYLLEKGAAIKLVTHQEPVNGMHITTKKLVEWFKNKGYPAYFSNTIEEPVKQQAITVLENIRLYADKTTDQERAAALCADLAAYTNYYIFDGFGVCHRDDVSVAKAPLTFAKENRSIGFLVQDELTHLYSLTHKAKHPFIALCAGNKEEKIEYIQKIKNIDTILLGPLHSLHPFNSEQNVIIPVDYSPDYASIGSLTLPIWRQELSLAKTVLCNGLMGILERPETLAPFDSLLDTIMKSGSHSIIAGGSTVSYVDAYKGTENFSFCSTGGGATLAFVAGLKLPGLEPFLN